MTEPATHKLDVPGATLCYDVRESASAGGPPLLMVGSPMGASGFAALADEFADRTVVTYDPRGAERSQRTDLDHAVNPDVHASDVLAVIGSLGYGEVDVFGSSGGAITGLALVAARPALLRTFVAHEPPLATLLPDAKAALAACQAIHETYQSDGWGAGMARFISLVTIRGPVPPDFGSQPAPDPSMFGLPAGDDGGREDLLLGPNMLTVPSYRPDLDALRAASTRIVVGVGADSDGELAHRGAEAIAQLLGLSPVMFPGGHAGFTGPEQGGAPGAFAPQLRAVLDGAD